MMLLKGKNAFLISKLLSNLKLNQLTLPIRRQFDCSNPFANPNFTKKNKKTWTSLKKVMHLGEITLLNKSSFFLVLVALIFI